MSVRTVALLSLRAWSTHFDRVWLASATMLLVLFLLAPAQGQASLAFTASSLLEILPHLLASILGRTGQLSGHGPLQRDQSAAGGLAEGG